MATLKVDAAEYVNGELILKTSDRLEAFKFAKTFEVGNYEIKKAKKRRSLDANAYAWVLLDKLASALRINKQELYKNAVRSIGGVSEMVCTQDVAVETICDKWCKNGVGWQTEVFPSKIEGCSNVTLYYGSSTYNAEQMARLIDFIVQDCKALEIETKPQEEINSLLESWGS